MHFPPHAVELAPDSSANERVHLARARGEGGKRSALKWCRDACRVIEPRHHAFRDSGVPGSWVGRLVGWEVGGLGGWWVGRLVGEGFEQTSSKLASRTRVESFSHVIRYP
jgi:hypothetical protein